MKWKVLLVYEMRKKRKYVVVNILQLYFAQAVSSYIVSVCSICFYNRLREKLRFIKLQIYELRKS